MNVFDSRTTYKPAKSISVASKIEIRDIAKAMLHERKMVFIEKSADMLSVPVMRKVVMGIFNACHINRN